MNPIKKRSMKRTYHVLYSYVVRSSVGGRIVGESAGTNATIEARGESGMVLILVKELSRHLDTVLTEFKIIKVG